MHKETPYKLSKNEYVAVFVSLIFVVFLLIIPTFDLFTNSSPSDFMQSVLEETEQLSVYEIRAGSGQGASDGDKLSLHYEGRFPDGTVFDSSYGKTPFSFVLGSGEVILGWDIGLRGMAEGATRILVIPPEYGYGDVQFGPIPANSTLLFEIELLELVPISSEE